MSTPVCHTTDEEYTMPCAEALLGGTLALMMGLTQGQCGPHRERMAHKIVAHLAALAESPQLSDGFRQLLHSLRARWLAQHEGAAQSGAQAGNPLLHRAPAALQ